MRIISHRGYWKKETERNQLIAFRRSFDLNYGTEADFRDHAGEIVISHDMPNGDEIKADAFFSLLNGRDLPIAINIKADGQANKIKELLERHNVKNYFVFDMSIPDTLQYLKLGLRIFTRLSEYEPEPAFYNQVSGLWVDSFHDIWYSAELIQKYLDRGKEVSLVSPELHKRDPQPLWYILKKEKLSLQSKLILCTDLPEAAARFFDYQ